MDRGLGGLADRLTVAIDALSKGFELNFPSLAKLHWRVRIPADDSGSPGERLKALKTSLERFRMTAAVAIAAVRLVDGGKR